MRSRKELTPSDHPDKELRKVLTQILDVRDEDGHPVFRIVKGGHWGHLICSRGCCKTAVSKTPRNAARHARNLRREANKCPREDGDVRKTVTRSRS
ncbi:MAG: hypothetical protein ACRCYU_19610 [Nocardioides sp.]